MSQAVLNGGRVVIVGGGVIGMSVAFHLAQSGYTDVVVLERGDLGEGATAYATGGIRRQFSSRINVELVRNSIQFWSHFQDLTGCSLDFRQHGYLFLHADRSTFDAFRNATAMQRSLGTEVQVLSPDDIGSIVPGTYVGDLVGATYSPLDGSASPADAMAGYARVARRHGVEIRRKTTFLGIHRDRSGELRGVDTSRGPVDAERVILAAGPQSREVGSLCGLDLPVFPHSRQAFATGALPGVTPDQPLTVDMKTGAYLHPEAGGTAVVGGNDRDAPVSDRATVDWPRVADLADALIHRFPRLEALEVVRGWAGLREMTPDDHAIVGPANERGDVWVAAGFSGHGFMQSPAVGASLAQMCVHGSSNLDLTPLRLSRFQGQLAEPSETAVF